MQFQRYTVGSHPHEPHETRSIKIWSATFSKILQASELLRNNAIQFYMEKEAFDQILDSGTSSPSLSLWGHLNSLIEAAGHFFLYWVIIQPVLVVCTLFQSHITTRSEIKAKIRFCIYTISHITIEPTVLHMLAFGHMDGKVIIEGPKTGKPAALHRFWVRVINISIFGDL